jgi:hypothetical protein
MRWPAGRRWPRAGWGSWSGDGAWQFVPAQPQFAELPPDLVAQTAVFHDESGPLLALRGYTD